MNDAIRASALRSTARVALSLTVLGCGARVEIGHTTGTGDATSDDPLPSGVFDPGTPDPVCASHPFGAEGELLCCADHVRGLMPETAEDWEAWQVDQESEDVQRCCRLVVDAIDEDWERAETLGFDVHTTCCGVTGHRTVACTPWGPPTPPAFDPALLAFFTDAADGAVEVA